MRRRSGPDAASEPTSRNCERGAAILSNPSRTRRPRLRLRLDLQREGVCPSTAAAPAVPEDRPTILQIIPQLDAGGAELSVVEIAGAVARAGGRALVLAE